MIKSLIREADILFNSEERVNAERYWSDIAEFILNNQFTSELASKSISSNSSTKGDKKTRRVYDSTAMKANHDLASAFQGTLMNPATQWYRGVFKGKDKDLNDNREAVTWLEDANKISLAALSESNLALESGKAFQAVTSMANTVVFHEEKETEDGSFGGFRFTSMHISQVAWAEDKDGRVDTIHRKFKLTAKQIVEKWGDTVNHNIVKTLKSNPYQEFEILHSIYPRDKKKVKQGLTEAKNRPIASTYIDITHNSELEDSGYYELPAYAMRFSTMPGETYGRGPGHIALPDIKTLNTVKRRGLEALANMINPPILANKRDVIGPLNLKPKGVSIVKNINGIKELESKSRRDALAFDVETLQRDIRSIFFVDQLLLPPRTETGEMTAYEVSQRIEQMNRVLGPTVSRFNVDFMTPVVSRSFKILLRAGELPPLPDVLVERGVDLDIIFINQLARSQQVQELSTMQQWVQSVAVTAQIDPQVVDNIDADGIAIESAKILGVPEVAVRTKDEVQEIRAARQQQAQQQQALDAATQAADIGSKTQQ